MAPETEDEKWALLEEAAFLWDAPVLKQLAHRLGLVTDPLGPNDPVPTRPTHH